MKMRKPVFRIWLNFSYFNQEYGFLEYLVSFTWTDMNDCYLFNFLNTVIKSFWSYYTDPHKYSKRSYIPRIQSVDSSFHSNATSLFPFILANAKIKWLQR